MGAAALRNFGGSDPTAGELRVVSREVGVRPRPALDTGGHWTRRAGCGCSSLQGSTAGQRGLLGHSPLVSESRAETAGHGREETFVLQRRYLSYRGDIFFYRGDICCLAKLDKTLGHWVGCRTDCVGVENLHGVNCRLE